MREGRGAPCRGGKEDGTGPGRRPLRGVEGIPPRGAPRPQCGGIRGQPLAERFWPRSLGGREAVAGWMRFWSEELRKQQGILVCFA